MKISRNPFEQLNNAASKTSEVAKSYDTKNEEAKIHIDDLYKSESYEFSTPWTKKEGWIWDKWIPPSPLNSAEVLDRLTKGQTVLVTEHITLAGTYDNLDARRNYNIKEDAVKTILGTVDELNSFANVESGAEPKNELEKLAHMLEDVEYKPLPGRNGLFFEIRDKDGESLSSMEAAKRLMEGGVIQLSENNLSGKSFKNSKCVGNSGSYGWGITDPKDANLKQNQTWSKVSGSYSTDYFVTSEYKVPQAKPTGLDVAFNSPDQLKEFLTNSNK